MLLSSLEKKAISLVVEVTGIPLSIAVATIAYAPVVGVELGVTLIIPLPFNCQKAALIGLFGVNGGMYE